MGNTTWRSELTSVEKLGDDLCGGLKVSSNVEIARSLRNNFRVTVAKCPLGVERLNSIGGLPGYPSKPNSEYRCTKVGQLDGEG